MRAWRERELIYALKGAQEQVDALPNAANQVSSLQSPLEMFNQTPWWPQADLKPLGRSTDTLWGTELLSAFPLELFQALWGQFHVLPHGLSPWLSQLWGGSLRSRLSFTVTTQCPMLVLDLGPLLLLPLKGNWRGEMKEQSQHSPADCKASRRSPAAPPHPQQMPPNFNQLCEKIK